MRRRIDLAEFPKRADLLSGIAILLHLLLVFSPLLVAAWLGPSFSWIILWAFFGFLMNGILNLMHECAHFHLFKSRKGSDFVGHWLVGPLLLADFEGYRERHWKHHTHLGVEGDTKDAYLVDIRGTRSLRLLVRCLTSRVAMQKVKIQGATADRRSKAWLRRTVVVQLGLLLLLVLFAGPLANRPLWPQGVMSASLAYGGIYLYGLASVTVYAATLRAIAEHQLEAGESSKTGRAALRNFRCGPIGWLVFGAYGFAEHATHHLEPALPYYHLKQITSQLAREDEELKPTRSYIKEIFRLARRNG
jgi:fatty acid desaturase